MLAAKITDYYSIHHCYRIDMVPYSNSVFKNSFLNFASSP
jgi:hypothetical protein